MTSTEINLSLLIVQESFGELARKIASHLIVKKTNTISLIAEDLKLNKKQVSQILAILIKHQLVEYKLNARQFVEYKFSCHNALNRIRLARQVN